MDLQLGDICHPTGMVYVCSKAPSTAVHPLTEGVWKNLEVISWGKIE